MREQYKRYIATYDRQILYDNLRKTFPAAFTDLVLTTKNQRIRYTAKLIETHTEMDTTEILKNIDHEFGPLNKRNPESKKLRGGAKTIYQRKVDLPIMKKDELKLVELINNHPDWNSEKLQEELIKIKSSES